MAAPFKSNGAAILALVRVRRLAVPDLTTTVLKPIRSGKEARGPEADFGFEDCRPRNR
jgi:hypothetical protein